jgi:hypothetical protein
MATGTVPTTVVPPPLPASTEHDRVIRRQLGRTSLHVRLVDLGAALAMWIIGVLVCLLVAVAIDHWIAGGLGAVGRALALVALVGGSVWFWAVRIVPLLIRSINPTYAARTIEEATPSLKNSLVNFLMLRHDHSGVREVVFQAVEQKAAADIAVVPVESTVDRTRLIRAGYVLCGVMALFAAYKILSPKDPFPTVARVIVPWANIARPARVEITDVKPGDAEVYHGQILTVSATVIGTREGDPVTLLYTTADGQTVDRAVPMSVDSGGLRYQCTLPPADTSGLTAATDGLRQDATYRIVAGDAETPEYRLSVVAAPTIIVERLEYQFPPYTKKALEIVPQAGDIKALEGTRVTIHAVANQPIKSAWVEFDPGVKNAAPEVVQLAADGSRAWGAIVLQLKPDRKTPWHTAYQVRFYNERGQRSQQPIVHQIEVIRDLPPEVQMLQPQRLRVEVPEDGEQKLEVRALDPDYGLSAVRIEGSAGGEKSVKIELLDQQAGQVPQATTTHAFKPREHGLKAGDELKYVAVAEDNRTGSLTGQPDPNVARTAEYTLVVVPPRQPEQANNPNQQPMPGQENKPEEGAGEKPPMPPMQQGNKPDMNPPKQGDQENPDPRPMQGDKQQGDKQQQGDKSQSGQPQQGDKQQGDKQQGDKQQGDKQQGDKSQAGDSQQGDKQQGDKQQGDKSQSGNPQQGQPQEGGQGDKSQSAQPQQGGSQQGSSDKSQSGDPQQGQPMGGQAEGSQPGQPSGKPAGNSQQPAGQQGDPNADASGQPNGAAGPTGKAHDGQAIEEVLKDIQRDGQGRPNQGQPNQGQPNSGQPRQGGQPMPQPGQENQGQPMPGDKTQGQPTQGEKPAGGQPNDQHRPDSGGEGASGTKPMGQKPEGDQPMAGGEGQAGDDSQKPAQSGAQGSGTDPKSKLGGDDQKLKPGEKGADGQGDKVDPMQRLPGDKQGQNPSEQRSQGNEGGESQGADKTDKAQASKSGQGEKKEPGAGESGDEGAGKNSTDKTGSGQGQEANRDKPKEMQPGDSKAQEGEPSPPSGSKRQSDSQGDTSGDQSGGGGKGAGQSAGQEGNDSAGSKSAADQGAGAANETGSGETGSKAGSQKTAAGKTGQSGNKPGEGSASKPGDKTGDGSPDPGKSGAGPVVGGGGDGDRPKLDPAQHPEAEAADKANLDYAKKATDMVLQRLKDQEHNPDPELLDKLGWTQEDLAEFIRRWDALQKSADKTPEGQRELDEALRSLGLRDPANRKRAGGATSDSQRDLRDSGGRSNPPAKYRNLFDAFRKGAARASE